MIKKYTKPELIDLEFRSASGTCSGGSSPGIDCNSGGSAQGDCITNGGSATSQCTAEGQAVSHYCTNGTNPGVYCQKGSTH